MQREFLAAVERRHHRDRQQAARVPRQAVAGPYLALGVARDDLLEFLGMLGAVGDRAFDVRTAKNGASYGQLHGDDFGSFDTYRRDLSDDS